MTPDREYARAAAAAAVSYARHFVDPVAAANGDWIGDAVTALAEIESRLTLQIDGDELWDDSEHHLWGVREKARALLAQTKGGEG